jgi:hypothetical protein
MLQKSSLDGFRSADQGQFWEIWGLHGREDSGVTLCSVVARYQRFRRPIASLPTWSTLEQSRDSMTWISSLARIIFFDAFHPAYVSISAQCEGEPNLQALRVQLLRVQGHGIPWHTTIVTGARRSKRLLHFHRYIMNLRVKKVRNFLISWLTIRFSWRTLLHGVRTNHLKTEAEKTPETSCSRIAFQTYLR